MGEVIRKPLSSADVLFRIVMGWGVFWLCQAMYAGLCALSVSTLNYTAGMKEVGAL